jgi:molybdopterin converting factor small subunit
VKLQVRYAAQLRAILGRSEEDVDLPEGSNLADLLLHLADNGGCEAESHLITAARAPRPSLLVVVNDSAVSARAAANLVLNHGDTVTLLPPIAGG